MEGVREAEGETAVRTAPACVQAQLSENVQGCFRHASQLQATQNSDFCHNVLPVFKYMLVFGLLYESLSPGPTVETFLSSLLPSSAKLSVCVCLEDWSRPSVHFRELSPQPAPGREVHSRPCDSRCSGVHRLPSRHSLKKSVSPHMSKPNKSKCSGKIQTEMPKLSLYTFFQSGQ